MRAGMILLFLLSSVFAVSGQSIRALQIFEKGTEASRADDHANAKRHFEETLRIIEHEGAGDRFFAKVHYNLGVSNYHLRDLGSAAVQLEKAIGLIPRGYEKAYYALGLIRTNLGEWPAAEQAFRKAIALNDRNGEAWFDLAFVYVAQGSDVDAQKAFGKAIKHGTTELAISHNNLGALLANQGRYNEAMPHFETAARLASNLKTASANLEKCRERAGKSDLIALTAFALARRSDLANL